MDFRTVQDAACRANNQGPEHIEKAFTGYSITVPLWYLLNDFNDWGIAMHDMMPMIAGINLKARFYTLRIHFARELTPRLEDDRMVGEDPPSHPVFGTGPLLDVRYKCIST